jgi:branched-chain amino acid transport system ATP-binding protein
MSDAAPLILDRLSVERGGRLVVRDVSIEVERGAVTALLGPNGAGKSSLVLAVGGLLRTWSGRASVGDQILTGRRPERVRTSGVAIVPEGRRLLPALTTHDNLRVATYPLSRADGKAGVAYALELFPELEALLGQVARTLSGGQQQMVVLAQALVSRPSFLLIDELSLGLAPVVVRRLVTTLREVAASGVGILLVEQFTSVALGLARRAYVLEGGQVRFDGTAEALRADPDLLHSAYLLRGRELPVPPAPREP